MLKNLLKVFSIQYFASLLDDAIKYISEPEEIEKTLMYATVTADLVDTDATFDGNRTVNYQHIEFGKLVPGTFTFANGYGNMDVNATWRTFTLTQDIGDSISIDKIRDEEAMGNGLIKFSNRYIQRIQAPSVDRYRFGVINTTPNTTPRFVALTVNNIIAEGLAAFTAFEEARMDTTGCILYITPGLRAMLKQIALTQAFWSVGNWNGDISVEVEMFNGAKVVPVPSDLLPANVNFVMINKNAVPAWNKYSETEIFDKIPGFGKRKLQADIGLYHDCFVYSELSRAIYICYGIAALPAPLAVGYVAGTVAEIAAGAVIVAAGFANLTLASTGVACIAADLVPGTTVLLPAAEAVWGTRTFGGWSDGSRMYPALAPYVIPRVGAGVGGAMSFQAIWNEN